MKNIQNFISQLITIEFISDSQCYGHYPFQMFVETSDGGFELNALALGGDVVSCYRRVASYVKQNAKRIYMSLDFPAGGDIENDFVCIFSYEGGEFELFAMPYDPEDGTMYDLILDSSYLTTIKEQLMYHIS